MADVKYKNVQTLLKPFARVNAVPLDRDEIWDSVSAAEQYVNSPMAYAGQTIKVLLEDGKYQSYTVQPHEDGEKLVLEELKGVVDESQLKQYIQIVDNLPEEPEDRVIYVLTTNNSGYIWLDGEFKQTWGEVVIDTSGLARLDGATFTGDVILASDPIEEMGAATKQYVDRAIAAGGGDPAEAIAKAKEEAISEANAYTNDALTWGSF